MSVTRHSLSHDCIAFSREVRSVLSENQLTLYGQIAATVMVFALAWSGKGTADTAIWVIGALWTIRIPELAEAWLRVRADRASSEAAESRRAPIQQREGE